MAADKLAVWETVEAAYNFVTGRIVEIVLIGAVPIGLSSLIGYYAADATTGWQLDVLDGKAEPNEVAPRLMLTGLGSQIATVVLVALAAVAYHRMVLFEERGRLTIGRAFGQFLLVTLLIGVFAMVLGFAISIVAMPLIMLGSNLVTVLAPLAMLVLFVWLSLRLAPVFPHVIASGRVELSHAWGLTRHKAWRLFAAYALVLLPIGCVFVAVSILFFMGPAPFEAPRTVDEIRAAIESQRANLVGATLLGFVYSLLTTALGVAVLSYAYKSLNGRPLGEPLQAV